MSGGPARTRDERFWSLVNGPWCDPRLDPYDDCWIWMGARASSRRPKHMVDNKPWKPYGRFHWPMPGLPRFLVNAHRAALLLTVGEPPDEAMVGAHLCDTPLCVHPGHLRWETQVENVAEAFTRNRLTRNGGQFATTGVAV